MPSSEDDVECVYAAIAYGSEFNTKLASTDLIENCISKKVRLDIWMRYDHTVPVAIPLLKRLLKSHNRNVFCRLIPDALHAKIIWWKGYGAYVGSANLSERAWSNNIETGVFFTEEDLESQGMRIQIEAFFDALKTDVKSFPLSSEIIENLEKIDRLRSQDSDKGKNLRLQPYWEGPTDFNTRRPADRRKEAFREEWNETLTTLRKIGEQLESFRPSWISEETPTEWQIDQFLHAYYYNKVTDGKAKPFEDFYSRNKANPQNALTSALYWWKSTISAPTQEDVTFEVNAPYLRSTLSESKILNLSIEDLSKVFEYTHATKDHVIKIELKTLGRPDLKSLTREERLPLFAEWMYKQRNAKGWDIRQLLKFVLYDGDDQKLWERLFFAARDENYVLPHYGLNSIAEIVGWVRPDVAPPRNGRTSKALRALGYDVKIY